MDLRKISAEYGVLDPENLSFLRAIFDEICTADGSMDEDEVASVARKLLVLFNGGTRDRELLKLAAAPRPRARSRASANAQHRQKRVV